MSRYDLHQHESDECFWRNLANCEVSLYLTNLVFDGRVRATLEPLHFALHFPRDRPLAGSTQRGTVDEEYTLSFCIDVFLAFAFVGVIIVRIVGWATWWNPECLCQVEPGPAWGIVPPATVPPGSDRLNTD